MLPVRRLSSLAFKIKYEKNGVPKKIGNAIFHYFYRLPDLFFGFLGWFLCEFDAFLRETDTF